MAEKELSFGERAVGINFNHAEGEVHDKVHAVKVLYATIIDTLNDERAKVTDGTNNSREMARHLSIAITEAETAQMRAVKALTWEGK